MKTNKRYATAVLGSLACAAILTGAALAGNPHGTPPGQAKKQSTSSTSVSSTNSTGVKPSSTTKHNTTATADSNQTKVYGNGKTAGQIAGGSSNTTLYGPGNSQPHKAALCPGSKHTVDVHALKAHGGKSCPSGSTGTTGTTGSTSTSPSTSTSTSVTVKGNGVSAIAKGHGHTSSKGAFTPPSSNGSVRGAQHSLSVSNRAKPAHAVLGTANFTG